jgi:RNA polymerase sigma-70 factor (ECF subfamily)
MLKGHGDLPGMGEQHPTNGSSLSTSLLLRVVALEPEAWERLVRLFGQTIYRRCRRRGLSPEEAADLLQEVFLAAAKSVARFRRDGPGASFRAWLWGIARHKLKDHWEARANGPAAQGGTDAQRRLAELAAGDEQDQANDERGGEEAGLVRRAVDLVRSEFEERTWQAFWRFEVDGLPAAEVAGELGMTPNAVHIAVYRVRKRLREEFGDLFGSGDVGDEPRGVPGP